MIGVIFDDVGLYPKLMIMLMDFYSCALFLPAVALFLDILFCCLDDCEYKGIFTIVRGSRQSLSTFSIDFDQ